MSEWASGRVSEWASEWVSEWVSGHHTVSQLNRLYVLKMLLVRLQENCVKSVLWPDLTHQQIVTHKYVSERDIISSGKTCRVFHDKPPNSKKLECTPKSFEFILFKMRAVSWCYSERWIVTELQRCYIVSNHICHTDNKLPEIYCKYQQ